MTDTASYNNTKLAGILSELVTKRQAQDAQWGGPEHDDTHDINNWIDFIDHQLSKILALDDTNEEPDEEVRSRLLNVAALAIAAVQSIDRYHSKQEIE